MRRLIPHALLALLTVGAGTAAASATVWPYLNSTTKHLAVETCQDSTTKANVSFANSITVRVPSSEATSVAAFGLKAYPDLKVVAPAGFTCFFQQSTTGQQAAMGFFPSAAAAHSQNPVGLSLWVGRNAGLAADIRSCYFSSVAYERLSKELLADPNYASQKDGILKAYCTAIPGETVTGHQRDYTFYEENPGVAGHATYSNHEYKIYAVNGYRENSPTSTTSYSYVCTLPKAQAGKCSALLQGFVDANRLTK